MYLHQATLVLAFQCAAGAVLGVYLVLRSTGRLAALRGSEGLLLALLWGSVGVALLAHARRRQPAAHQPVTA